MKNRYLGILSIGIGLAMLVSCQDLIETKLDKKTVTVLAPANNTVSPNASQQFWWDEVKGADNYKLQIVKPNFSAIQQLVMDTTITANQFSYSLLSGSYQWRIRAMNGSSYTEYSVFNLTIDSTLDLGNQWVILTSPVDNYFSANNTQTFTWQTLPNATSYLFQVLLSGLPIHTETLTTTTTSYTFASENTYQWRVLAQNNSSTSSPVNSIRTITIDHTAPPVSVQVSPAANDTSANPVSLTWQRDASGSADSIFIYADSLATTLTASTLTTNQNYSFNGTVGHSYFWKIRSGDNLGNWSAYSNLRKFSVVQ